MFQDGKNAYYSDVNSQFFGQVSFTSDPNSSDSNSFWKLKT